MKRWLEIVREAWATSRSQPVASIISVVIVAGMCATVLLTTGRTVGAEQAVLSSIDSAGTRSIIVRADSDAGLDVTVLDRLANIDGIEWVGAFGPATDVTNTAINGGTKVPSRLVWTDGWSVLGLPAAEPLPDKSAWVSDLAREQLGMPNASGGLVSGPGADYAVVGRIAVPDYLTFLEPVILVPQAFDDPSAQAPEISVLVVIASSPDLVSPVSGIVQSILGVDDPTKVKITTSESLATLRALIQGQLGSFGRNLVIVVFALTAVLVAAILYGLVMLRRKDFGRRRALGASQGLIIGLLLAQMALLSIVGTAVGCAIAALGLAISGDPLPGLDFFLSVAVLAVFIGVVAALLPAIAAARRDPLKELRVP